MIGLDVGFLIIVGLIVAAEFVNGATDAPNSIATVICTRVLSPRAAIVMATVLNALGVMSGTAVAVTIGKGFVQHELINLPTIGAALVAIVLWSSLAWYYGLPTSESHALVAGLTGAGFAMGGVEALVWSGWVKVLVGLFFSTVLGFGGGFVILVAISWAFRRATPRRVGTIFGKLQIGSAAFMAFSHGSNDGQKFMGVFALALIVQGFLPASDSFAIPWWVMLICAGTMALGTAIGGWRIIRTMGRMTNLQPYQGFAAETGAATAIELASCLGIPVSTTHTINTSIMGVGAARRLSAVRWGVVREVVAAWILTFPVCAIVGYLVASAVRWLIP